MALLSGLMDGGSSFVEIRRAQKSVKELISKLKVSTTWGHLAKTLVELSQDFANADATRKVFGLFEELLGNLHTSRVEMDQENALQIQVYENFMEVS